MPSFAISWLLLKLRAVDLNYHSSTMPCRDGGGLEEPKDTGRSLSTEEEARLLKELEEARSPLLGAWVKSLLLTCMRCGELSNRSTQVDFENSVLTVGKAGTEAGTGRKIPMSQELFNVMTDHAKRFTKRFGQTLPEHFLFPAAECWPNAPRNRPSGSRLYGEACERKPRSNAGFMTSGTRRARCWNGTAAFGGTRNVRPWNR
jgi:hypothetical protein